MTDNTRALLEQALESLWQMTKKFNFERLHESRLSDSKVRVAAHDAMNAIRAELAKPVELSYTATQLAAMVLSDCGISTNHTALHERVAERITRHEERLIDSLQKLAKLAIPAWHDAPTEPGLWMCNDGDDNPYRRTTHRVTFPLNQLLVGENERWYGPIPQDGEKS